MDAKKQFRWLLLGLKVTFLWPPNKSKWYYKPYRYYTVFVLINIGIFDLHQLISCIINVGDFERLLTIVSGLMACAVTLAKSSMVYKNIDTLQALMEELDDQEFEPKTPKQQKLLKEAMKKWSICFTSIASVAVANYSVFAIPPLFDSEKRFPIDGFFPFSGILQNPLYPILYLWQVYCLVYVTSYFIYPDHMYSGFMAAITGQCAILANTLEHLPEISKRYQGESHEERMNKGLEICINHHKKIVNFADKARGPLNWAASWQYFGPMTGMAFQLTYMATMKSGDNTEVFIKLVYLVGLLVSPLIYAWFGQEVIYESSKIPQSAFYSGFEDCSMGFKKNLQYFMHRTQKPIKFFIMGYVELSLDTYIRLLRASYSFYTVLKQTSQ